MTNRAQTLCSVVLMLISLTLLCGAIYLIFVFPRTLMIWTHEGRALTVTQQAAVGLGNVCKTCGFLTIFLISGGLAVSTGWMTRTLRKRDTGEAS